MRIISNQLERSLVKRKSRVLKCIECMENVFGVPIACLLLCAISIGGWFIVSYLSNMSRLAANVYMGFFSTL